MYFDRSYVKVIACTNMFKYIGYAIRSLEECADMVPKVLDLPFVPTAIEFLERELIDIVERSLHKTVSSETRRSGIDRYV